MSIISVIWAIIFLICIILESHETWMDWILYRVAGHQLVELCIPLAAFLKLSSQCKDIPVKIFLQRYSSKKIPPKISLHSTCGIPVIIQQMQIYSCPQFLAIRLLSQIRSVPVIPVIAPALKQNPANQYQHC